MSPEFQTGQYLRLSGVRVPQYKAKSKLSLAWQEFSGFVQLPEVLICAGISFGMAAADIVPLDYSFANVGMVFVGHIVNEIKNRTIFAENNNKALRFNTKPNETTPPTDLQNLVKAEITSYYGIAVFAVGVAFSLQALIQHDFKEAIAGVSVFLPFAANAYRFNKVAKGDWVITDKPPKQQERQPKKSLIPVIIPRLTT